MEKGKSISEEDKYIEKNISEIKENPNNFFSKLQGEEFEDFVESVKEYSIIEPIVIDTEGMIITGHNRYRAAKHLGEEKVRCIVKDVKDEEQKERMLIHANIKRRHLSIFEQRKALEREKALSGSQRKAAESLNLSRLKAVNLDAINNLIPELQQVFDKGDVSIYIASTISKTTKEEQIDLYKKLKSIGGEVKRNEIMSDYAKQITDYKKKIFDIEEREKQLIEEMEGLKDAQESIKTDNKKKSEKLETVIDKNFDLEAKLEKATEELNSLKKEKEKLASDKKVVNVDFKKNTSKVEITTLQYVYKKYFEPIEISKLNIEDLENIHDMIFLWINKIRKALGVIPLGDIETKNDEEVKNAKKSKGRN